MSDWIEHDGKEPKFESGTKVEVKMKGWDGHFRAVRWEYWMDEDGVSTGSNWHWEGSKPDHSEITHYRVVGRSL